MWMRETAWEWGRWRRRRRRRSWTVTYNEGGASVSLSFSLSPSPSSLSLFAFLLCLFCFSYLSAPPSPSSTCIFSLPCSICGGTCNVHLHCSTEMFQLDFFFFFFFPDVVSQFAPLAYFPLPLESQSICVFPPDKQEPILFPAACYCQSLTDCICCQIYCPIADMSVWVYR